MKSEYSKYERITDILKKTKPILTGSEAIEDNIMVRIRDKRKTTEGYGFLDSLFGWVYIGWVRNGLVAASILIISVFVVQQSILLKRINSLEQQAVSTNPSFVRAVPDDFESTLLIYRQSGKISLKDGKLSDKQLKQLEKSINDLQTSYRNLLKLVEDNPEFKQYVENRLSENEKKKINL